jgi:XTP/dITP diphosphohydrolase
MKTLIIASNNAHKIEEIKEILKEFPLNIISQKEAGIFMDVVEDKDTFLGNAHKKAYELYESLGEKEKDESFVLSDDSGLSVDYLGGAPGVYSARYAGEGHNDGDNNRKLLKELSGVKDEERTAKFVSAIVFLGKDVDIRVEGEAKGRILHELTGSGGFGYDPLFYSFDLNKTFGEATAEEKNGVSHRAHALMKLKEELKKIEDRFGV